MRYTYSPMQSKSSERQALLRKRIIQQLGGACSECGLKNERALEICGGKRGGGGLKHYYQILRNINEFHLLCANCNNIQRTMRK
jgi:predicted HNH restriction endonuclease